jgi:WD40 repeat protein
MSQQLAAKRDYQFLDDATIMADEDDAVSILTIAPDAATRTVARFPFPEAATSNASTSSVDRASHRATVGSLLGDAILIEGPAWHVAARAKLCDGWISGLQMIPGRRDIAYLCHEGTLGIWDPDTGTIHRRAHLEGESYRLRISPEGDYLVMAGGVAQVYMLDLRMDLLTNYKGFDIRPTVISPPTAEAPFVTVGNGRGEIRVWAVPPRIAKTVVALHAQLNAATFVPGSTTLIATPNMPELVVVSPTTGVRTLGPHDENYRYPVSSPDGKIVAAFGRYDEVELWSMASMTRTHLLPTGHGVMSQLQFLSDSTGFVTSGFDGRLVRWTMNGDDAPTLP